MSEAKKKAKVYSDSQIKQLLNFLNVTRYPLRNHVIVLLGAKAGLRACEIAGLRWSHVLNDECNDIGEYIRITDDISKSYRTKDGVLKRVGGRRFEMSDVLKEVLKRYYNSYRFKPRPDNNIILNQQCQAMRPGAIAKLFHRWFKVLGWFDYSSHSGRRTFITNAARKVSLCGGSLEDVRRAAGHTNLKTTQGYIAPNSEVMKKLVNMI